MRTRLSVLILRLSLQVCCKAIYASGNSNVLPLPLLPVNPWLSSAVFFVLLPISVYNALLRVGHCRCKISATSPCHTVTGRKPPAAELRQAWRPHTNGSWQLVGFFECSISIRVSDWFISVRSQKSPAMGRRPLLWSVSFRIVRPIAQPLYCATQHPCRWLQQLAVSAVSKERRTNQSINY